MENVAIVIATQYGQTERIAQRIAERLRGKGVGAEVFNIQSGEMPRSLPSKFDAVIVGAPVYAGKFSSKLIRWVRDCAEKLNSMPCGFFSVSLNAADSRPQARVDDDRLIRKFLNQTTLKPGFVSSIAGTVHYPKYNFFIRWIIKRISASAHGPTDTSREHEMTDWSQVDAFADAFFSKDESSGFASGVRFRAA